MLSSINCFAHDILTATNTCQTEARGKSILQGDIWDKLFSNNAGEENSNSKLVLAATTIELMLSRGGAANFLLGGPSSNLKEAFFC